MTTAPRSRHRSAERDRPVPELDGGSLTLSELLLRYIPGAMLVKAFNAERRPSDLEVGPGVELEGRLLMS